MCLLKTDVIQNNKVQERQNLIISFHPSGNVMYMKWELTLHVDEQAEM